MRASTYLSGLMCGATLFTAIIAGAAEVKPVPADGDPAIRRLSPAQYEQTLTDIFGRDIKLGGRFETEVRDNGLFAVGASRVSVTSTGLQRYDAMARNIAEQVVDKKHRTTLVPCTPASLKAPDDACARQFLSKTGRLLYRRPMTEQELKIQVSAAARSATTLDSFYDGLGLSLAATLASPQFLFRREVVEPDPKHRGQYRLDAYSKASQISFMLWNSAPDKELLAAAESGDIHTEAGLARQVDRLLASPRLEAGIRAFFDDMLHLDEFDTVSKDAAIYPKFTTDVARDAREQTMRTIVDHVLTRNGDYRDLFTTRRTFLTPGLGSIYRVAVAPPPENDSASMGWQAYEFPEGDLRAGLLTQVSFISMHSHPGRSSPTLRGKALREIFLCQKVPDPPGAVNFTLVQDTGNQTYKTARERLKAHATEPMCSGCHKLIDPMGLALESFDSAGGFRTTENGATIDTSGEFEGKKFADAAGLGKAVQASPATTSCLVNRLYSFAVGRAPAKDETPVLKNLEEDFTADGYKIPSLLRRIATSEALFRVAPVQTGAIDVPLPKFAQINTSREVKP